MEFRPLFQPLEEILSEYREYYVLPYQIGMVTKERYPDLWNVLIDEYGEAAGSGAGTPYSWASQIARALDYCMENNIIQGLHKSLISTDGIEVRGIPPGNEVVSIWKIN